MEKLKVVNSYASQSSFKLIIVGYNNFFQKFNNSATDKKEN